MKCVEIELAVATLFGIRQNVIVPNISWGLGLHECDLLILRKSGYAVEVEIKVSKADLKKDLTKTHKHKSNKIKELYYAVPVELVDYAKQILSSDIGVISCKIQETRSVVASINRKATTKNNCIVFTEDERSNLMRLGCMRIWGLKRKLINLK